MCGCEAQGADRFVGWMGEINICLGWFEGGRVVNEKTVSYSNMMKSW